MEPKNATNTKNTKDVKASKPSRYLNSRINFLLDVDSHQTLIQYVTQNKITMTQLMRTLIASFINTIQHQNTNQDKSYQLPPLHVLYDMMASSQPPNPRKGDTQ